MTGGNSMIYECQNCKGGNVKLVHGKNYWIEEGEYTILKRPKQVTCKDCSSIVDEYTQTARFPWKFKIMMDGESI
jgi:Zn finger protein HypA/HybF involved in hydrogenase expression